MIRKSIAGSVIAVVVILGGGTWFSGMKTQTSVEQFIVIKLIKGVMALMI